MGKFDLAAILLSGFIAGTIDIGAAALINFVSPIRILHFIAGGLLGKTALAGGASVALLGLVLQWAMSLIIATVGRRAMTATEACDARDYEAT